MGFIPPLPAAAPSARALVGKGAIGRQSQ